MAGKGVTARADLRGLRVLIADMDSAHTRQLGRGLSALGADVLTATVLSSPQMSGMSAVLAHIDLIDDGAPALIESYKADNPAGRFFIMLDSWTTVTGPEHLGALVEDYLPKPLDPARTAILLSSGSKASGELQLADPLMTSSRPYFQFRSEAMLRALVHLPRIAGSSQTVLIQGDTGTGKEIISRAIHFMSPRSAGPFVAINCGAIPETLIEAELFGHERGAFTGAHAARRGKFETADQGTLLLDEIGEMPLLMQVKLLRVLEEGVITRVGGERTIPVDVRVIAATRRDLRSSVAEGTFREDLYYRLSILRLQLPPLSERPEDVALLAVHFMNRALAELGSAKPYPALSSAALRLLETQEWRGNVRELRNLMTRVATLLPQGVRQVLPAHIVPHMEDAPVEPTPGAQAVRGGVYVPHGATLDEAERIVIANALREHGGNKSATARALGIGIRTIRRKLNERG